MKIPNVMSDNKKLQQLHDKATRGDVLTATEQATLDTWYERQDAEEMAQFAVSSAPTLVLAPLRAEVSAAIRQLNEIAQRIQAQSDENEKLRQQNTALGKQLG